MDNNKKSTSKTTDFLLYSFLKSDFRNLLKVLNGVNRTIHWHSPLYLSNNKNGCGDAYIPVKAWFES